VKCQARSIWHPENPKIPQISDPEN